MKEIFPGYYTLNQDEFESLWENAIFIFDTNVLLNLYRYQPITKDSLLGLIERLNDRVWIPYQVGLEYQRNRLSVIAEQQKAYSEVRKIVNDSLLKIDNEFNRLNLKRRHSNINPEELLSKLQDLKDEFFSELSVLEEGSLNVNSKDEIRENIDRLLSGKVGDPPENQTILDNIFKEGEVRFKNHFPPGFKDNDKNEDQNYCYAGLTYKSKYGDLVLWQQIIEHAKKTRIKHIIFVTDDNKSDWWWKVESSGPKIIGCRPELIDEIKRKSDVDHFYIYNTERFLAQSKEQFGISITQEIIEEVRDVAIERQRLTQRAEPPRSGWKYVAYLSYSDGDNNLIVEVKKFLKTRGVSYFHASRFRPGEDFYNIIPEAIEYSKYFFYFVGPNSGNKRWQQEEVKTALVYVNKRMIERIFPVILPGGDPDQIPVELRTLQYIDLRENFQQSGFIDLVNNLG